MAGQSRQDGYKRRYRLAVAVLLGVVLALAGGASRYDENQQMFVRLAAIATVTATLWPLDAAALRRHTGLLAAIGAAYLLLLLQLVPLPPSLWASLSGHALYARIAAETGTTGWRPLSLTPDLTVNALFALLPATAAGLCALHLDLRDRIRFAHGVIAVAAGSALLGLVQLGAGGTAFHFYRQSNPDSAVGLFANRNHQAALIACALPLLGAIAGLRLRQGGDRRMIAIAGSTLAVILLLALVSTGSRMGLLLGTIGTIGAGWCYRASGGAIVVRGLRRLLVAATITAIAIVAIVLAAWRSGAIERLLLTDRVNETRIAIFRPLLTTARAFMPFGAGFGSFDSVYRQFEPNALLSIIYMNEAHNEVLQLAIEGGLPVLCLLGLFCWWWTRTTIRVVRSDRSARRRTMGIAAVTITVILMASSLVDYPLRTPLLGALFAIACIEMRRAATTNEATPMIGAEQPSDDRFSKLAVEPV